MIKDPAIIQPTFKPNDIASTGGNIGAKKSNQTFSNGPIKKHQANVPKCTKSLLIIKNTKKTMEEILLLTVTKSSTQLTELILKQLKK